MSYSIVNVRTVQMFLFKYIYLYDLDESFVYYVTGGFRSSVNYRKENVTSQYNIYTEFLMKILKLQHTEIVGLFAIQWVGPRRFLRQQDSNKYKSLMIAQDTGFWLLIVSHSPNTYFFTTAIL
jgi:hypothetical protein